MSINPRSIFLIVIALLTAGGTAMMARNWLQSERSQQVSVEQTAQAVVAEVLVTASSLPAGRIIKFDDLTWLAWPEDGVTDYYIVKGLRSVDDFVGAVVRRGLATGTPFNEEQIVKPGERGFLAAVLLPGMRAVSVPISATSGISGFVFPGDRVDLILTHQIDNGQGSRHVSETVLTGIRVLAVDQRTNDQENSPVLAKTATLELTPKQVEKVAVLRRLGTLSLSLRSLALESTDDDASGTVAASSVSGQTHTWDAEVSSLLPPVDSRGMFEQVVVVRAGNASAVKFGRITK